MYFNWQLKYIFAKKKINDGTSMYVRQIWQERKVGGFIAHSEGCGVTAALGKSFTFLDEQHVQLN